MTPGQEIRAARRAQRAAREAMPNTQRMGTGPGATEAVRDVSERLSKLGYLTRDREMRHAETIAEAAKSRFHGNVEEILKLDEHEVLNAADGLAVRDTRDRMIEDWLQRAAQADESDPAAAQRVFDEYLLASKVVGTSINEGTAAGRTLEARSIVTNPARASELDYTKLSQDMDELRRGLDGVQVTPENVLQVARDLKDRSRVSKLMADAAKAPSAWWKIYYGLNLLSTPLFHLKNTIGNSTALTASMAGRLVGEITSAPFVAFGKRSLFGQPLVAPGETMDLVIGSLESVRDAFRAGRRTFDTGESMFRSTGKFAERADLLAQHRKSGFLSGLVDTAARLAEKNLRFAGGTDEFYKVLAFTGEQRALARRQAWASGAKWGEETLAEQARLINEPTRDIIDGAAAFADDATFTRAWDADTWSGRLMAKAESFAGEGLMRVTVTPFFHTPMRITEFATEHTPGLNLLMSGWWGDMKAGGANAQLAMAKVAVGGSMMYALSSYAAAGYITGDYSKDPALRARQIESGFKPFAFYVPQADKYISYAGLGPMVAPLAAVAQYAQMAPNVKDDGLITLFSAMTIAAAKTTLAQPYFDAASDVLDIFESLDNYESGQKAVKYVADRIQSFVPGASALRYVAAATEGERKDMKEFGATFDPEWRDVMNLFAQTAASIPGMASYVPAKRNIITGEAIPNEGGKWAGMVETPTNDPVLREILELGGASLPREFPRHVGGDKAPEDTFRLEPPKPGTVQPLTHEQRTKLAHLTTKVVKQRGKTLHEALADMIESDKYKAQSDGKYGGKALMIHQMWHAFADGAEERLIKEDLGLQEMIRRAQQDKLIQLAPTELQDELKERYAR